MIRNVPHQTDMVLRLHGYTAWIEVEGRQVEEHAIEVTDSTVSCYICSEDGLVSADRLCRSTAIDEVFRDLPSSLAMMASIPLTRRNPTVAPSKSRWTENPPTSSGATPCRPYGPEG